MENNNIYPEGFATGPTLNSPQEKGKSLKWILGLILIVIIAGGFYFLTYKSKNNPVVAISSGISDMSNWKTYENNDFGFRFKYPEELNFNEDSNRINLQLDGMVINGPDDYRAYLKEGKPSYKIILYRYSSPDNPPKHSQQDCNVPDNRPGVERLECTEININGSTFVRVLSQLSDKISNGELELTLLGTVNSADFIAIAGIPSGAKQKSYLEVINNMFGTLEVIPLNLH